MSRMIMTSNDRILRFGKQTEEKMLLWERA
jgi:hypothetical protein